MNSIYLAGEVQHDELGRVEPGLGVAGALVEVGVVVQLQFKKRENNPPTQQQRKHKGGRRSTQERKHCVEKRVRAGGVDGTSYNNIPSMVSHELDTERRRYLAGYGSGLYGTCRRALLLALRPSSPCSSSWMSKPLGFLETRSITGWLSLNSIMVQSSLKRRRRSQKQRAKLARAVR